MSQISSEFLAFFAELEHNNNREWFNANKKRYQKNVQIPFEQFISNLISAMQPFFKNMNVAPKDCIFRIYKDVRFSKDKTPYKDHASALISPLGKKDRTTPALYLQSNHKDSRIYSGCHMLNSKQLKALRVKIALNTDEFLSLINDEKFVQNFGEVHGEKNKRIAKDFDSTIAKTNLIFNKSFYYFKKFDANDLLKADFNEKITTAYSAAEPLNNFIKTALK